jgi:hypothetical protein
VRQMGTATLLRVLLPTRAMPRHSGPPLSLGIRLQP